MSDVQPLLEQARSLGKSIGQHKRMRAFNEAREGVQRDPAAQQILQDYSQYMEKLQRLEAEGKPIEPTDKRKLAEIEGRMSSNDALKQLMRAQADYIELMDRVNSAMEEALAGPGAPPGTPS